MTDAPATPGAGPASATRAFQLGSIFVAYAAAGVFWGAWVAALPAFQATSGLSTGSFGLLLTSVTVGGILAMQALGRVLHRVQAIAIPACLAVFAVGMAGLGLAPGPVSIGAALFLAGAASGALDIALNMRVARIEQDFGLRLFNRVHALFPFAMLVTSALIGLAREWGATPAILFPPLSLLLLAAAAVEYRAGAHQRPEPGPARGAGRVRLRGVLLALGALAAFGAIMEGGANVWSAIYVEGPLGAGPALSGIAAAAITLGLTTGRLTAHMLEHRYRDMAILGGAALIAAVAFVILAVSQTPGVAILGFFLAGLGAGPVEPAVFRSVTRRHNTATRGRALALATGLAYVGYLAAPPVLGRVVEGFGWGPMWVLLCALGIVAAGLSRAVPPAANGNPNRD
jgi:predicted MFS family arabinose efflux permease